MPLTHEKMMQHVFQARGLIINEAIAIERCIDFYLADLFGGDKETSTQLRDWVFTERIPFEKKIQIFRLAISKHNKAFEKDNPDFAKDLIYINEQRNIFAHYLFLNDEEQFQEYRKTGTYHFAKFSNDSTILEYTQPQLSKVFLLIDKYAPVFTKLAQGERASPPTQ